MKHNASFGLLLLFLTFGLVSSSLAQNSSESERIKNFKWNETEIAPGLVWKQGHFDTLFSSVQEINYLEIDLKNRKRRLGLAGVAEGFKATSGFAKENNALAAINASFFNTKTGGSVTRIVIDGEELNQTELFLASGARNERANGALVLTKKGKRAKIIAGDNTVVDWDVALNYDNLLVSGPVLLQNGKPSPLEDNAFNNNRHPRSVVAILPGNKIILMAIDGRNAQAQGMNMHEVTLLLEALGAIEAINLDGGGSTALFIQNQEADGIVNYPSDNKLFDHKGERKVANAILVF